MMSREDTPRADVRRRLLNDMGIEVWYSRAPEPATGEPADPVPAATVADRAAGPPEPAPVEVPVERADSDPPSIRAGSRTGATETGPLQMASPTRAETAFSVEALAAPGVLLVAGAFTRPGEVMLAKDVVRAARRDWSAGVRRARFDWPQPGAAGEPGPALEAFVEKQAGDCGAKLLLITELAAALLHPVPLKFTPVPDIATLSDPQGKLALWRRLQELRL